MSLETGLITGLATVTTGVVLVILGFIVTKFFLEPLHELRQELTHIRSDLVLYEGVLRHPNASHTARLKARVALRRRAAPLAVQVNAVPGMALFALLGAIPPRARILASRDHLLGLSDSVMDGDVKKNQDHVRQIERLIG